jgi:hypothetical protein
MQQTPKINANNCVGFTKLSSILDPFQNIAERVDYTEAPPQGDIGSAGSMSRPRGVWWGGYVQFQYN